MTWRCLRFNYNQKGGWFSAKYASEMVEQEFWTGLIPTQNFLAIAMVTDIFHYCNLLF